MGRLILYLLCSCVLGASACAQANTPRQLTAAESAELDGIINRVKNLPAHWLDRRLPKVTLAEWLQAQAGPDARMNWVLRYDQSAGGPGSDGPPNVVEADTVLNDRQAIVVQVAVTHCDRQIVGCHRHVPSVFRIDVITGKNATTGRFESTELDRLRDLPRFLQKLQTNEQ
jgi:hypothetical protein